MILAFSALLAATGQQPELGIPSAYHGVWDAYPSACDYAVSDMRLGINSEDFTIYRDQFRVHRVTRKDDGTLVLNVSFRWHDEEDPKGFSEPYDLVWTLSQSGNELTMTSGKGATTWHRCPIKGKGK